MNIYLLEQSSNTGYDTYDSCVCIAKNEEAARNTTPSSYSIWGCGDTYTDWAYKPSDVKVTKIGLADSGEDAGVICASFNAG